MCWPQADSAVMLDYEDEMGVCQWSWDSDKVPRQSCQICNQLHVSQSRSQPQNLISNGQATHTHTEFA